MLTIDYPNDTDITYTYDRLGRRETVVDASTGTAAGDEITFDYEKGKLKTATYDSGITQLDGKVVTRVYDSATYSDDRLTNIKVTDGATTHYDAAYAYESATSRIDVVSFAESGNTYKADYDYKEDTWQIEGIAFKKNTSSVITVDKTYEKGRLLKSIVTKNTATSPETLMSYTYTHNGIGQRTEAELVDGFLLEV